MNNRASLAEQILMNPLFRESFTAVEADIIERIKAVDATDVERIIALTTELQLLAKVQSAITTQLDLGRIADFNQALTDKVR